MPIHKEVNRQFFKTWSSTMAYVLGFFAADGSMIKNNRGAHFIEFSITDQKLLEKIRKALNSNHKISARDRSKEWKTVYRLQIGSKEMFNDLTKLGFTPNKAKSLTFPEISPEFMGDFIRGYFDGDGNVYFKKHFAKDRQKKRWVFATRFTSACPSFLENLHDTLKAGDVNGGFIQSKARGHELVFSHHDSLALYKLMYNNGNCSIYLERKKKIFDKAISTLGYLP